MSRHNLLTQPPRGSRRSGFRGSLRLGALFALLVGINVYVFFFRDNTSIKDLLQTGAMRRERGKKHARGAHRGKATAHPSSSSLASSAREVKGRRGKASGDRVAAVTERSAAGAGETLIRGSLKGHGGLASALAAAKLGGRDISALITALEPKLDLRSLRPRHHFEIYADKSSPHRLERFIFHLSPIKTVVVRRGRDGALRAQVAEKKLKVVPVRIGARVTSSLDKAIVATGESVTLIYRLLRLFSWDINWSTDVRQGDSFRIIVEKRYLDGKFYGYGKLLASEYRGKKTGRLRAFYFRPHSQHKGDGGQHKGDGGQHKGDGGQHKGDGGQHKGDGGYYTQEGRSVRRPLLKTPLNYRRISSHFTLRRFHPVLHKLKAHLGVDYAAAPGTPIHAAGDGVILVAKRAGAAGKMIQIRHSTSLTSVYMHMLRFARGIKRGVKVKQWQVIGFVGSTGRTTGPHLHFGLKVRGRYVDPLSYPIPRGPLLSGRLRGRFSRQIAPLLRQLDAISVGGSGSNGLAGEQRKGPASSEGRVGDDDDDLWS